MIKYNKYNKSLFLENKNGKYDTLILIRENIKIREEKHIFKFKIHIFLWNLQKKNLDKIGKELIQFNTS